MKTIGAIILGLILLVLLTFVSSEIGLIHYQFFAPKYENARRKTFENTQSYVDGKVQDLANMKAQYDQAKDQDAKQGIQGTIRLQFANFDINKCPDGLKDFLIQMRGF